MSTEKTLQAYSKSLEDTFILGENLAKNFKGGEVVELISDVGGGKTALVRGMASGIKSKDEVASPTFTINRNYRSGYGNLKIEHYDFYRLEDPGILKAEIEESLSDEKTVVVIEWADIVKGVLPEDRLSVTITVGENEGDREFSFSAGQNHQHLLEGVNQ